MPRNTRKTILFFHFLLFLFGFISCKNESVSKDTGTVKIDVDILLGRWYAINDPNNIIELTKDRMFSFHGDLKLADESLVIYQNCISKCVPEGVIPMPCLVTDGKMAENCFEVLELTAKTLSYSLIGGKGKVLKFKRM